MCYHCNTFPTNNKLKTTQVKKKLSTYKHTFKN